jgi:hypothetical protein
MYLPFYVTIVDTPESNAADVVEELLTTLKFNKSVADIDTFIPVNEYTPAAEPAGIVNTAVVATADLNKVITKLPDAG